jgi:hypothetical protein
VAKPPFNITPELIDWLNQQQAALAPLRRHIKWNKLLSEVGETLMQLREEATQRPEQNRPPAQPKPSLPPLPEKLRLAVETLRTIYPPNGNPGDRPIKTVQAAVDDKLGFVRTDGGKSKRRVSSSTLNTALLLIRLGLQF